MQKCYWLLFVILIFQQNHLVANQVEPNKVTISGKSNSTQQNVDIVVFGDPLMYEETHFQLDYQPDGSFLLDIPVAQATLAELHLGDNQYPIFLEPGKEISLQISPPGTAYPLIFDSLKTRENRFLSHYQQFTANHNAEIEAYMATANASDYKQYIVQLSKLRRRFVGNNDEYRHSGKGFQELINQTENYWMYNQLLRYAFDKPLFENNWEPLSLDQEFYSFLSNEPVSKTGLLDCPQYLIFLDRFLETKSIDATVKQPNSLEVARKYLEGESLWYITAKHIQTQLRNGNPASVHQELINFSAECKYPALQKVVDAMHRKSLGWTVGTSAPAFELLNTSNTKVSLEQYKGKVVLLDFWATWCGHCRDEMPALLQLGSEFSSTDFEVVFISADKSLQVMNDYVTNNGLKGNHLWGEMLRNSKVAKEYQVEALPASFLLDQNGKIVATFTGGTSLNEIRCYLQYLVAKVK